MLKNHNKEQSCIIMRLVHIDFLMLNAHEEIMKGFYRFRHHLYAQHFLLKKKYISC